MEDELDFLNEVDMPDVFALLGRAIATIEKMHRLNDDLFRQRLLLDMKIAKLERGATNGRKQNEPS